MGSIIQFAGDTAPDGWLMCDGTYHRQDVYRELYQVISNTYDKDSQSGKFSVPDIRGRVPVGKHSTGTFNSLNKKGGVESVTLTKNQVPFLEHSHTMDLDNKFKYPDGTDSVWPESAHWHTIGQFHTAQSSDPHSQVFHDGTVDDHKFVINNANAIVIIRNSVIFALSATTTVGSEVIAGNVVFDDPRIATGSTVTHCFPIHGYRGLCSFSPPSVRYKL